MSTSLEHIASFRDPVRGPIKFGEALASVIDTYEVQRLHYIRQLSTVYLVHRSANHTRFEHSIGVAHLASKAIRDLQLKKDLPKGVSLSADDRMAEECAGIIHDVGHGPFGHMTESVLAWLGIEPCEHESYTREVIKGKFEDMDKEQIQRYPHKKSLSSVLDTIGKILNLGVEEIASLATGEFRPDKYFMAQLIHSPIDVDRFDFLSRDAYFVGLGRGSVDVDTLVGALTVVRTEHRPKQPWPANELAVDIGALIATEAMLTTRDHMYAEVYSHAVNRVAQAMLVRATVRLPAVRKSYRELLRLTDHGLLSKLRTDGDDYGRLVAWCVENRRVFQRVPELEYTYDDLILAGKWDEFTRYINSPTKNIELENELASELNPKPAEGEIIVDLPDPRRARFVEAGANICTRKSARPLSEVSPLVRFLNDTTMKRRWRMMVFVSFPKDDIRYSNLVRKFRDRFKLGEPSEYPVPQVMPSALRET